MVWLHTQNTIVRFHSCGPTLQLLVARDRVASTQGAEAPMRRFFRLFRNCSPLEAFTKLDDLSLIILKKKKSEAGRAIGITIHFAICYGETIASLQLSESRIQQLVELTERLAAKTYITLAEPQKAAGKLCFAPTMIMGRVGRAATRPLYELIAQGGGGPTRALSECLRRRRHPTQYSASRD